MNFKEKKAPFVAEADGSIRDGSIREGVALAIQKKNCCGMK